MLRNVRDTTAGAADQPSTAGIGGRNNVEAEGFQFSVDWSVNDAVTLHFISAWREDYTEFVIDFDSFSGARRSSGRSGEIAEAVEFIFRNEYFNGRMLEIDGGLRI